MGETVHQKTVIHMHCNNRNYNGQWSEYLKQICPTSKNIQKIIQVRLPWGQYMGDRQTEELMYTGKPNLSTDVVRKMNNQY